MSEFEDKNQNFAELIKKAKLERENMEKNKPVIEEQEESQEFVEAAMEPVAIEEEIIPEPIPAQTPQQPLSSKQPKAESYQPVSEVGVISSATTITGLINSKGHVRVEGNLIGDVFAYGDIKITGMVTGDIEGGNIELEGSKIAGNTIGRGDVAVGKDTDIMGDVEGQLITIDGKVEGNVTAHKGAHLASTAGVKGSISAFTMSMSSGAELMGKVDITKDDK